MYREKDAEEIDAEEDIIFDSTSLEEYTLNEEQSMNQDVDSDIEFSLLNIVETDEHLNEYNYEILYFFAFYFSYFFSTFFIFKYVRVSVITFT